MFRLFTAALLAALVGLAMTAGAAEYFVGPDGNPFAQGTRDDPWDIFSTLGGRRERVQPGDTIWILGGKYRNQRAYGEGNNIEVALSGAEDKPIIIRGAPGERAIIDGGVLVGNANYIWLWDLEITVTPDEPIEPVTTTTGSHPADIGAPNGGITIQGGKGQKFINLYIYENYGGGVGWWLGSTEGEFYGCVIVNNGWKAPDRNHGHCIYTQNDEGVKTIRHNIMKTRFGGGQYTMHAYGSGRAFKNNFHIEENIAYAEGSFLIGGGRPSHGIKVLNNYIEGQSVRVGYSARGSEDAEVVGNYIWNGNLAVTRFKEVISKNNTVVGGTIQYNECGEVEEENNLILRELPDEPKIVLLPNEYDENRAYLAVYNFAKAETVEVEVADFMEEGTAYRLMNPEDLFGEPLAEGVCEGETISAPMLDGEGAAMPFAALVLFKDAE